MQLQEYCYVITLPTYLPLNCQFAKGPMALGYDHVTGVRITSGVVNSISSAAVPPIEVEVSFYA